jgi:peptidoglycan hydrolase-like protein with peptidoglycan-binding domain
MEGNRVLSTKARLVILFSAALVAAPAFATTTTEKSSTASHKSPSTAHATTASAHSRSARKPKAKSHKLHGQQVIEPSRVAEIQKALIREHYLTSEANGNWDATTQAAMQKYQSDQGWQSRLIPDSRALKKLGLGPDYSGAINAEGASFTPPAPASTIPASQASGFAAAAGVNE